MKKFWVFCTLCLFSSFIFLGCQRDQGVQAGRESGTTTGSQSQTGPSGVTGPGAATGSQQLHGELTRVNAAGNSIAVREGNGMEQMIMVNDQTRIMTGEQGSTTPTMAGITTLAGKEGSNVTVTWSEQNGQKVATSIMLNHSGTSSQSGAGQQNRSGSGSSCCGNICCCRH